MFYLVIHVNIFSKKLIPIDCSIPLLPCLPVHIPNLNWPLTIVGESRHSRKYTFIICVCVFLSFSFLYFLMLIICCFPWSTGGSSTATCPSHHVSGVCGLHILWTWWGYYQTGLCPLWPNQEYWHVLGFGHNETQGQCHLKRHSNAAFHLSLELPKFSMFAALIRYCFAGVCLCGVWRTRGSSTGSGANELRHVGRTKH